jgi:pimeloyl-ACP methyl ester carboxylesterase
MAPESDDPALDGGEPLVGRSTVSGRGGIGIRLAWRAFGRGPAVLLVHGMGSSGAVFDLPAVVGYRWVAVDLPGFGASDLPPYRQTFMDYVETLDRLLAAWGQMPAAFVGHSFGAMVVTALATRRPPRALCLLAPAGLVDPAGVLSPTPWYSVNRVLTWALATEALGRRMLASLGADPERVDRVTRRALRDGWRQAREMARMGRFYRFPEMAETLRRLLAQGTGVAVLMGDRDPLFPKARVAPQLAGIPVTWLPGAGHVPMIQDPAGFLPVFLETLRTLVPLDGPGRGPRHRGGEAPA